MKNDIKSTVIFGVTGGVVFALVTAGLEYYEGETFSLWKFIFNIIFFGILTSVFTLYNQRKQNKKK